MNTTQTPPSRYSTVLATHVNMHTANGGNRWCAICKGERRLAVGDYGLTVEDIDAEFPPAVETYRGFKITETPRGFVITMPNGHTAGAYTAESVHRAVDHFAMAFRA